MKMNLSILQLDKLPKLGSGSECVVYDLGDGTCYKAYHPFIDVETIYYNAKIAHEFGIAPEVYERGENGYRTEIVELLTLKCDECPECDNDSCKFYQIGLHTKCNDKYQELLAEVIELFDENAENDLHTHNIGLKNGKFIMIDFGIASNLSGG